MKLPERKENGRRGRKKKEREKRPWVRTHLLAPVSDFLLVVSLDLLLLGLLRL